MIFVCVKLSTSQVRPRPLWGCVHLVLLGAVGRSDAFDVFLGGGLVCGLVGVPEVNVLSETPSLCWTCAQCPAPPQLCHRKMACKATGNTRQPCLWVQRVMQCCLHWGDWWLGGRHLSVQWGLQKESVSPVTSYTTTLLVLYWTSWLLW